MIISNHLCKSLRHVKRAPPTTSPTHVICCYYFQKYPSLSLLSLCSVRCISISSQANDDHKSFIVSYLVKNCGLSSKSALSASKYLHFKTPDRPDSVLAFFKSHGFSNTQITKLIHCRPAMLSACPEKTFLPKIHFLLSKGFSGPDTARILSGFPEILHTSLEKQIIPAFNVIKDFLSCDKLVICAVKRLPKLLLPHLEFYVIPNIKKLREVGLPESSILWLLRFHPQSLLTSANRLAKIIEEVKEMGLDPLLMNFVIAIHVKRSLSKLTWEKKLDLYKKWGWSEEECLVALGKYPWCVMTSEEKIKTMMDYYINKMGWDSSSIAHYPLILSLSLEKRVLPRCSIIQVLQSKGLIKLTSIVTFLLLPEKKFLCKFVMPYKEEVPHLLKLYQEKMKTAQ